MSGQQERLPNIKKPGGWYKRAMPLLLVLPSCLLLVVFKLYPIAQGFAYSLLKYNIKKPKTIAFVGLQNFVSIFTNDKVFWQSLWISAKWVVLEIAFQLFLGMVLALLLNRKFRGRGLARTISFVPWAVSGVLTTMIWLLMYNEYIGFINNMLELVGLGSAAVGWLANKGTVFPAVMLAELWRGTPFFAITLLAGLQGISNDVYEAARIDGAGAWRTFIGITLPLLKQSIVFSTLMRMIWEFQSTDLILTMTDGGPLRKTTTLTIYTYKTAIANGDYGYGSALATVSFLILSVLAAAYLHKSHVAGEEDI